jgi:predicted MFS family arabinose efflux permease
MDGYIENPTNRGWLTSIMELGSWFGALSSSFVSEYLSRKYGILIMTGIFILGVIIQATSIVEGHQVVLAGRFITGIGVGGLSMIVPLYGESLLLIF